MKSVVFSFLLTVSFFSRVVDGCASDEDCLNGGSCVVSIRDVVNNNNNVTVSDPPDDATCFCAPGFGGTDCAETCSLDCHNGGSCRVSPKDGSPFCECSESYAGESCEIPVVHCGNQGNVRCLYGGTCLKPWTNDNRSRHWACQCPATRTGNQCENESDADQSIPETSNDPTSSSDPASSNDSNVSAGGKVAIVAVILAAVALLFYSASYHIRRRARTSREKQVTPPSVFPSTPPPFSDVDITGKTEEKEVI